MAIRPFAFGVRLRDKDRTLRVKQQAGRKGWVVEDRRGGKSSRSKAQRSHTTLTGAMQDLAATWRSRLH